MRSLESKELKFEEKKHVYTVGQRKFDSVTTFISSLFKPFDAKGIARMLAKFPVNKAAKRGVRYWLKEWKLAASNGTEWHAMLEDYVQGKEVLEPNDRVKNGMKYLKDYNIYPNEDMLLYPEVRVYDEKYGLAGSCDLLSISGDKCILSDWKFLKKFTTKSYKGETGTSLVSKDLEDSKVNRYGLQLMIYAYILRKNYGVLVDELHIVHLLDKRYVVYIVEYDEAFVERILGDRI